MSQRIEERVAVVVGRWSIHHLIGLVATAFVLSAMPVTAGIVVYPDTVANPRTPTVAPEPKGARGACMEVEKIFAYPLAPLVSFTNGGSAAFFLRDNRRRLPKAPLTLEDGKLALAVTISPASEGRKVGLELSNDQQKTTPAWGQSLPTAKWTPVTLRWTATNATLEIEGKVAATMALPAPFNPKRVSLNIYHIDELALSGKGTFKLGWENGYAANVVPPDALDTAVARLHGFDAMVVSQEPPRRDCPMIQVCNVSSTQRTVTLRFSLASEVRSRSQQWSQSVTVSPLSSREIPIKFSSVLETDIYHLRTQVEGAELPERDGLRNFMFVARRADRPGPPKFGFHSYGVRVPGSWPDALPAHWRHIYANWGYIVGPMWIKDWDGKPGLNPDTPPDEWWWDHDWSLEWAAKEGRKTLVSASSAPYFPWMREREYEAAYMTTNYYWGNAGGRPNFERYRQFIRALATRYKGKVDYYELDNEPNTLGHSGKPAAEYADVMKAAGEEIHAIDPRAKVFGISGTCQFVDYMRDAFAGGAAQFIDGVSWHTYTTPMLPGDAGLPQILKRAREVIAATGRDLPAVNTETGVYAAPRETADHPIPPDRLAELIKQGAQPFQLPSGWPNYTLDEWTAAKSMVQNITYNFAAGAGFFLFYGWDPAVEKNPVPWGNTECWGVFAWVKDGTMTPSLYTLACAVAMSQTEGILTEKAQPVDQDGIAGAIFDKAGRGQLAVLWSSAGRRTVMLRSACPRVEMVSLFGVEKTLTAQGKRGVFLHQIELDDRPVYLHVGRSGMSLCPSPVTDLTRTPGPAGKRTLQFSLVNRFDTKWTGAVDFASAENMAIAPAKVAFALEAGARQAVATVCTPAQGMARGVHVVEAKTSLPDGTPFIFPIGVDVRPCFTAQRVPSNFSLKDLGAWKPQAAEMPIDKVEQVAVGRPPELTSLQDARYWQGPNELSAKVATGYNDAGFFARVVVHDRNQGPLKTWPGVDGSCVEWFFDFRSPDRGLGNAPYEKGVAQIVAKPVLTGAGKVELWFAGNTPAPFKDVAAFGGVIDSSSYWIGIFVPWAGVDGLAKPPQAMGFDVAVDGPSAPAAGRKSQIILFGGASNCLDAAGFGTGRLE